MMPGELLLWLAFALYGIGLVALLAGLWDALTGPPVFCAWCGRRAPRNAARRGWMCVAWDGRPGEPAVVCGPECVIGYAMQGRNPVDRVTRMPCGVR